MPQPPPEPRPRIVIPGGSGFLGRVLSEHLSPRFDVVVLGRGEGGNDAPNIVHRRWDATTLGDWQTSIDGAAAVINLTGRSVDCRYNDANRRAILASRVDSTTVIGHAIAAASEPPAVWLNASSATIYAASKDLDRTEDSPTDPNGFSEDVCHAWEAALNEADTPDTRRVALRITICFGPQRGGAFDILHRLVRFGLGGSQGPGDQMVSWIHTDDLLAAVDWILEHDDISGPVNLAAPNPLSNVDFMRAFRLAAKMPIGLPTPTPLLRLGAMLLRTEPELVLKSRRVVPDRLSRSGFEFRHPDWAGAVADILARRRN